jgi:hypothetical protein
MALSDLAVRRDIYTSDLPSADKVALSRVLDRIGGYGGSALVRAKAAFASSGAVIQEGTEAAVVGGVLGAVRGKWGANVSVPGWTNSDGTPVISVPWEAVAAAVGYGGALLDPGGEYAGTMRRGASVAIGILASRKAEEYVAGTPSTSGGATAHGEFAGEGVDGITAAAQRMLRRR